MQNQLPILVFAQSARLIAESAAQAGFTVWVADCFCDEDTVQITDRSVLLPSLSDLSPHKLKQILIELTQGEDCYLVCGTGIESLYPVLNLLPQHIRLLGNSAYKIKQLKQAQTFFNLLDNLALPYPDISPTVPSNTADQWLCKSEFEFGGHHIHDALSSFTTTKSHYFQKHITGLSGSVCFIANGQESKMLSLNQQHLIPDTFILKAITTPFTVPLPLIAQLENTITAISNHCQLVGLNSLDFIIADERLYLLEVNPRISASAALLDQNPIFKWHYEACLGNSLEKIELINQQHSSLLAYIYADNDITIPENLLWSEYCHDLPSAGTKIAKNEPICSVLISSETLTQSYTMFNEIEILVKQNLD